MATFTFTSGADSVTGSNLQDSGTNTTAGNDTINGADDTLGNAFNNADLIQYLGLANGITVSYSGFGSGLVNKGAVGGTDTLISIERIQGTAFNDSIGGSGGNDTYIGGAGNDTYNGGAHDTIAGHAVGGPGDVLSYWTWGQGVATNAIIYTASSASSGSVAKVNQNTLANVGGTDALTSVELLQGTAHNDTFTGSTGSDSFYGSLGSDNYSGGNGNDFIGYSIPSVANATNSNSGPTAIRVDMTLGLVDKMSSGSVVTTPNGGTDAITSIESFFGTSGNDSFIGGDPVHSVYGFTNTAEGFGGGLGNDTIIGTDDGSFGGTVFVLASYSYAAHGVVVDLSTNFAYIDANDQDTFDHVTGIFGSNFGDSLTGGGHYRTPWDSQFDFFAPQGGNDTVVGSDATYDRVQYNGSTAAMTVDLTGFDDSLVGYGTVDNAFGGDHDVLFGSIEQVYTGSADDTVTGSSRDESFVLNFGNNQLDAGDGEDTIQFSNFISVNGVVVHLGHAGDQIGTATHDDSLGTLNAQTDNFVNVEGAVGTHFNDQFYAAGVDLKQKFEGLQGDDTLNGDSANLAFTFASYLRSEDAVVVNLSDSVMGGIAAHTADDGFGGTDALNDIQGVIGSMFDDNIFGSAGNNGFNGEAGFDTIDGMGGNDTVSYDRDLNGDDMNGDGVIVNLGSGTALDQWGYEDTLLNIQNVIGSKNGDAILGSTGNLVNVLDGKGGDDLLQGLGGADTLLGGDGEDTLDGGTGADSMVGGQGDDVYIVDVVNDKVKESAGEGQDVVGLRIASGTYTLAANVEDLYMIGGASINATASASATALVSNYMRGSSGANILKGMGGTDNLDGGKGDDALHGGNGKDQLHGGGGADAFVFGVTETSIAAGNADLISDFKSAGDHIDFENALFAAIGATNFTGGDVRFYAAAGAKVGHDTDDRIIYDTASGKLYYDADGSNPTAAVLVATLQGHPALVATDIHVI